MSSNTSYGFASCDLCEEIVPVSTLAETKVPAKFGNMRGEAVRAFACKKCAKKDAKPRDKNTRA